MVIELLSFLKILNRDRMKNINYKELLHELLEETYKKNFIKLEIICAVNDGIVALILTTKNDNTSLGATASFDQDSLNVDFYKEEAINLAYKNIFLELIDHSITKLRW